MAILIFHSIQLAFLYAFNSMEASILIIVMDPQFVLWGTISSSVIFLQGTTEPLDENKKFGYIKQTNTIIKRWRLHGQLLKFHAQGDHQTVPLMAVERKFKLHSWRAV